MGVCADGYDDVPEDLRGKIAVLLYGAAARLSCRPCAWECAARPGPTARRSDAPSQSVDHKRARRERVRASDQTRFAFLKLLLTAIRSERWVQWHAPCGRP